MDITQISEENLEEFEVKCTQNSALMSKVLIVARDLVIINKSNVTRIGMEIMTDVDLKNLDEEFKTSFLMIADSWKSYPEELESRATSEFDFEKDHDTVDFFTNYLNALNDLAAQIKQLFEENPKDKLIFDAYLEGLQESFPKK